MNDTHDGEAEIVFQHPLESTVHNPESGESEARAGAGAGWCSYSGPGSALPSTGYIYTVIT